MTRKPSTLYTSVRRLVERLSLGGQVDEALVCRHIAQVQETVSALARRYAASSPSPVLSGLELYTQALSHLRTAVEDPASDSLAQVLKLADRAEAALDEAVLGAAR